MSAPEQEREAQLTISWLLPDDYADDWRDDPTVDAIIDSIPEQHPLWGDVFIVGGQRRRPAPEQEAVSDEAVEAAAKAMFEGGGLPGDYSWDEMVRDDPNRADIWREDARGALTAALPHLTRSPAEVDAETIQAAWWRAMEAGDLPRARGASIYVRDAFEVGYRAAAHASPAEVEREVRERVAAETLREAADAFNTEGLRFKAGWGSNPVDQQTIDFAMWAIEWLRDRARSIGGETGGAS